MSARSYLGFDYGSKFIGVAVGSTQSGQAQALATVRVSASKEPDWQHLSRLVQEWRPNALVVGLPLNMDGSDQAMTRAARAFGDRLKERYNLPVHMVDERLTTRAAKDVLYAEGVAGTRQKRRLDEVAAQTILQSFLNGQEPSPNDDAPGR
ncbi:MAG TPA: Holliday junction resolvase RuvX [Burkholderiales bacterium]|nr:Holliday junction resolvase RuvX [Burkholderiales bacterium]